MTGRKIDRKKFIKWVALSIFLMAITVLPSFEAIDFRYRKSVDLGENPVAYQLKEGDTIEQKLILDKDDRLDDLRIWLASDAAKENKGILQIRLAQGEIVSETRIDTSEIVGIVGGEYVPVRLKLSRFTDGELLLTVYASELDDDASVSVRCTAEAIYGLPQAVINGTPNNGTLSLNYKICQPHDIEFRVSLLLVMIISVSGILASYVMTYTEETPKTGWVLLGLFIVMAMAVFSLERPASTWQGESRYEGPVFFYNNVANMGILNALRQLEGGMYLSAVQNIIMIVAVRILHLRKNLFVAVESMGILYLVLCLAPFCSHYFKKYFTRTFRFVCPLLIACFAPINTEFHAIGYVGAFFLILLLICDFEKINHLIYALILLIVPAVCMSKMMFVAFAPVAFVYYLLFRKEMNRKKKCCVIEIGIFAFMEAFLSILLKHGLEGGHRLGTIQHVPLPSFINKILYYTVQTFGIQFRCNISNANQLLENICMSMLVIGILTFVIWQIFSKGSYRKEAKFILVMLSLIIAQSSVVLLTTTDWHADIRWKQSVSVLPGYGVHHLSLYIAASAILLTFVWIALQYLKPHFLLMQEQFGHTEYVAFRIIALLVVVGTTFLYINQHANSKSYDSANPTRVAVADWKAYVPMTDSDAFCIRIEGKGWDGNNGHYVKNASEKSVGINRGPSVDLSNVAELNGRTSIAFYAHKTVATNQILDRPYYMNIYDKNGNFISRIRQINPDAERLYIGFYPEGGVSNVGRVDFTYEDGTPAFVDETIEIGYR